MNAAQDIHVCNVSVENNIVYKKNCNWWLSITGGSYP